MALGENLNHGQLETTESIIYLLFFKKRAKKLKVNQIEK
jgi:hypothetical protein